MASSLIAIIVIVILIGSPHLAFLIAAVRSGRLGRIPRALGLCTIALILCGILATTAFAIAVAIGAVGGDTAEVLGFLNMQFVSLSTALAWVAVFAVATSLTREP